MFNRRHFLQKSLMAGGSTLLPFTFDQNTLPHLVNSPNLQKVDQKRLVEAVKDEDFWKEIRRAYGSSPSFVNLNNGAVSPQAQIVQEELWEKEKLLNQNPSYFGNILGKGKEGIRQSLAQIAGCSSEEIALNSNTTEGMNTIIQGINWQKGDEVLVSKYAYSTVINTWKQVANRHGIQIKWIDLPLPSENKSELIEAFVNHFSSKTKVVNLTHVINWTGQVLPVKEICEEARKRNILSIVDGAHSFAHLDFGLTDLGCDYFATSLHKWLGAPFGTGLLYVRKDRISELWPLFPSPDPQSDDIRKFEHLGTDSIARQLAIGTAIEFHQYMGIELKQARLHYLKNYWCEQVKDVPDIKINTPYSPEYSGAIAHFSIEGSENDAAQEAKKVVRKLFNRYQIHTVAINWEAFQGIRITPNVYTSLTELDRLVETLER